MKQHIRSVEARDGKRRNDLRRQYNETLLAGAKKSFENSLSPLNGRRVFHSIYPDPYKENQKHVIDQIISGIVVDGTIVVDAVTRDRRFLMKYWKSGLPKVWVGMKQVTTKEEFEEYLKDPTLGNLDGGRQATISITGTKFGLGDDWDTDRVDIDDIFKIQLGNKTYTIDGPLIFSSPSQLCKAHWATQGIKRSCNGWRDIKTFGKGPYRSGIGSNGYLIPIGKFRKRVEKKRTPKKKTTKKTTKKTQKTTQKKTTKNKTSKKRMG